MNRGDVHWVDFDPSIGGEMQKTRPAVIVSQDGANAHLNRLQVVPLTSSENALKRIYKSEARVEFNGRPGKSLGNQLTTVSKERVKTRIGRLTAAEMQEIEEGIRWQLDL